MPRRTNVTRRLEMRERLLDSTVACLTEHGYARASTTLISRHAGVSRGAQVHHFPAKADLMIAAIEHVFEGRRRSLARALAATEPGPERLGEALGQMWLAVQGGPTLAWLELVVAARADPVLHAQVTAMTERLREAAADAMAALFDAHDLPPDALLLASAVMDGLVVQQLAGLGDERRDRVLALLHVLATQFTGAPSS